MKSLRACGSRERTFPRNPMPRTFHLVISGDAQCSYTWNTGLYRNTSVIYLADPVVSTKMLIGLAAGYIFAAARQGQSRLSTMEKESRALFRYIDHRSKMLANGESGGYYRHAAISSRSAIATARRKRISNPDGHHGSPGREALCTRPSAFPLAVMMTVESAQAT